MKPETVRAAIEEIKRLREQTRLQNARLNMFDDMMSLFNTRGPERGVCNGAEDICWRLEVGLQEDEKAALQMKMGVVNPDFVKRTKLD